MPNPKDRRCQNCACAAPNEGAEPAPRLLLPGGLPREKRIAALPEEDWQQVLQLLPPDLAETAFATKALQRRRKVRAASDLLRLVLVYALWDLPLLLVAAWAAVSEVAEMSDVAVLNRLKGAKTWLQGLVVACLLSSTNGLPRRSVHLRLIDASVICEPGSKGTDWRMHLSFDLGQMRIDGVEITDAHGGETLLRHDAQPGDILVVDRGYSHRKGLGHILVKHGQVVARLNWQNLPMADETGKVLDVVDWLRQVPETEAAERSVVLKTPEGEFPLRLISRRLAKEAAEAARRRLRQAARKKGRTPDRRSLEAAGYISVVSSLDHEQWPAEEVLQLYRFRWQVEMLFKRLKGVLDLDHLRAKDPALAQVYLLGKLLGALIVDRWSGHGRVECAEWFASTERPVSPWRWLTWWSDALCQAVRGTITLADLLKALPKLRRYFCDRPRRRGQQYALARRLIETKAQTEHILVCIAPISVDQLATALS